MVLLQGEAAVLWLNEGDTAWRAMRIRDFSQQLQAAVIKATFVDADRFGLIDSAAAWVLKYFAWSDLKTQLTNGGLTSLGIGPTTAPSCAIDVNRVASPGSVPASPNANSIRIVAENGATFIAEGYGQDSSVMFRRALGSAASPACHSAANSDPAARASLFPLFPWPTKIKAHSGARPTGNSKSP
mgnify:CR=1 FL=1